MPVSMPSGTAANGERHTRAPFAAGLRNAEPDRIERSTTCWTRLTFGYQRNVEHPRPAIPRRTPVTDCRRRHGPEQHVRITLPAFLLRTQGRSPGTRRAGLTPAAAPLIANTNVPMRSSARSSVVAQSDVPIQRPQRRCQRTCLRNRCCKISRKTESTATAPPDITATLRAGLGDAPDLPARRGLGAALCLCSGGRRRLAPIGRARGL